MLLLLYQLLHLKFEIEELFLRLLLTLLLADARRYFSQQDVFEGFDGLDTLRFESAGVADCQFLRFRELVPRQAVLDNPIVSFEIIWVKLEASPIVKLRLINLIPLQVSESEISVQIRLELNYLLDFILKLRSLIHEHLIIVIFAYLRLRLQFLINLLCNNHCLLPTVDGLQVLLLLEESVPAILPILQLVHILMY